MAEDLEDFIRQQKAKIKRERQELNEPRETHGHPTGNEYRRPGSPEYSGLAVGAYEDKRRNLQEERKKEYNDHLSKKPPIGQQYYTPRRNGPATPLDGGALRLNEQSNVDKSHKLKEERKYEMQLQMARSPPSRRMFSYGDGGGGTLPISDGEKRKQVLFAERQREMQQQMSKDRNEQNRPLVSNGAGLLFGGYDNQKSQLKKELRFDMQSQMRNMPPARQRPVTPLDGGGLLLGAYEHEKKRLIEERKHDTRVQMEKQQSSLHSQSRVPQSIQPSVNGTRANNQYEDPRNRLNDERNHEYRQYLAKNNPEVQKNGHKENQPPAAVTLPGAGGGLFSSLGSHDAKTKKLQEERKKEYNQKLSQDRVRSTGVVDNTNENYVGGLPGMSKVKEQNQEYNENVRDMNRDDGYRSRGRRRPPHDALSDEDDDYGRSLRDHPPRKGWGTPTYEEILERKRLEERSYRRNDDIDPHQGLRERYPDRDRDYDTYRDRDYDSGGYGDRDRGRLGNVSYMRNSISDGHLNKRLEEEDRRFKELDRDYERRKMGIMSRGPDAAYTNYRREREGFDQRGPSRHEPDEPDYGRRPELGAPQQDRSPARRAQPPQPNAPSTTSPNSYNATLMIGGNVRASADQRRKATYRDELQRQMDDVKAQKAREKQGNVSGAAQGQPGLINVPDRPISQLREQQQHMAQRRVAPQTSGMLDNSFRNIPSPFHVNYGYEQIPRPDKSSILAQGFGSQLFRPNPIVPSSQKGSMLPDAPDLLPQLDDSYNFYAQHNPMDGMQPGSQVPVPDMSPASYGPPRPQQNENTGGLASRQPPGGRQSDFVFSDDDRKPDRAQKQNYQAELLAQMEASKRKKDDDKRKQELYDQKKEEEIRNYDPFGRGGAGAPVKDQYGNVVTNRKQAAAVLSEEAELKKAMANSQTVPQPPTAQPNVDQPDMSRGQGEDYPDLDSSGGHARGGHGIFGEPMTAAQKRVKTTYQEELRMQMEERKRQQDIEKAKQQEEEAKIMRKIEEDNRTMQEELDKEKRKEREKQEENQRQQEELRRQQMERRKAEEERGKAEEDKRQAESRKRQETETLERERDKAQAEAVGQPSTSNYARSSSPPVPALKIKLRAQEDYRTDSPPVPALQKKSQPQPEPTSNPSRPGSRPSSRPTSQLSRKGSADVLQQLARMKQQLANEQKRVETDLKTAEEPIVYDPRKFPSVDTHSRQVDIFEVAQHKQPVSVRRGGPDPKTLNDFNDIKNRRNSATRQNLRAMYPTDPVTRGGLEAQQRALLREQEDQLRELGGPYRDKGSARHPRNLDSRAHSNMSQVLDADTAFVTMSRAGELPDDLEDLRAQSRNSSARSRRRQHKDAPSIVTPPYIDPMGSTISLDPDVLSKRNEERLRKLNDLTNGGDDMSLGDPDDILERFMAKQVHNRPATVGDDLWLLPGASNA